jgi:hypothetical protein
VNYWQTAVEYSKKNKSRVDDCRVSAVTDILDAEARVFVLAKAVGDDNKLDYTKYLLEPARCYVENTGNAKYQQQWNATLAEALNKAVDILNDAVTLNTSIVNKAVNRAIHRYCAEPIKFPTNN